MIRPVLDAPVRLGGRPDRVVPPPEPQELPAALLAPVYDFVPLGAALDAGLSVDDFPAVYDRPADPLVFGVPLQAHEVRAVDHFVGGRCGRCQVTWADRAAPCWNCGRIPEPIAEFA